MKKTVLPAILILLAAVLIAALPTDREAKIYEDTLRLHILANSDSKEDQALKLAIRDKLLLKYSDRLASSQSIGEATAKTEELLCDIERDATQWIRESGYDYSVTASLGKEWYDTRVYDEFTLPKGVYTSLQIVIGEGDGKNWWCVMYPPLCMDIATEDAPADDAISGYSDGELTLIRGGKYNVKFKILEILSSAFSKNG